ncbi:MAG: hypothetical protein LBS12_05355 [Prevotellaceae bacterium]|jgi:uncharacterized protein (TIGR02145 family)|nr:hypothetical protein [Prevotellaceae bacterium]
MKRNKIQTLFLVILLSCLAVQGFSQANILVAPNESFTISNLTAATAGSEYRWLRDGEVIPGETGADYSGTLSEAGLHLFVRQARKAGFCNDWMSSNPYGVLVRTDVSFIDQGGCTFTQPEVVATFANFRNTLAYSSPATFVSLIDTRDYNSYAVVKIGTRWIMAQNLNYQWDLTFYTAAADPTNTSGYVPALIGTFWCPGQGATATLASCNVWGALYSWETAMMIDGKWSDGSHSNSTWVQPTGNYGTGTATANPQNHARADTGGFGGRGICPPNWHIPTDYEWGVLHTDMTTGIDYTLGTGRLGPNDATGAGAVGKAQCGPPVNDANVGWTSTPGNVFAGDPYNFRVLPAGYRFYNGSTNVFYNRGVGAYFWSSTAQNTHNAWCRYYVYADGNVFRENTDRSDGMSVRCIMDELE